MKRLLALFAVGGMVVTGLAAIPPAVGATPRPRVTAIHWGPCAVPMAGGPRTQCAYLAVPLDYQRPGGAEIHLALSRVRHTTPDAKYQGVVLVNPGGPGGAGRSLSFLGQVIPHNAGASYDWIGFDPRGVGESRPALSCLPNYFHGNRPPYVPSTSSILNAWLARSKAYADACAKDAPALLAHMTTIDAARDMDSIRAALGVAKINYYGYSYGTYLGQVYTTLFPLRVRRMVLDSNVDPRSVWYRANLDQDPAVERNMRLWFGWLAKYDATYHLGTTAFAVQRRFYAQEAAVTAHPAGGVVGPSEWDDAFLGAGYYQFQWVGLGDVFSSWVHQHDTAKLVAAYKEADFPGDDNSFAVYNAVSCTDAPSPRAWSVVARDNWRAYRIAPFYTWENGWFNAPCLYWPAKAHTPVDVKGHDVRALLVDQTLDAPTQYEGSLEVRRRFPRASLIAVPGGTTHANSLRGNACIDNQIADYLATGKLPPRRSGGGADAICKADPRPIPGIPATASDRLIAHVLPTLFAHR